MTDIKHEPVGMFWTDGKGNWKQSTKEHTIKGITYPLYLDPRINLHVNNKELQYQTMLLALKNIASVTATDGGPNFDEINKVRDLANAAIKLVEWNK